MRGHFQKLRVPGHQGLHGQAGAGHAGSGQGRAGHGGSAPPHAPRAAGTAATAAAATSDAFQQVSHVANLIFKYEQAFFTVFKG